MDFEKERQTYVSQRKLTLSDISSEEELCINGVMVLGSPGVCGPVTGSCASLLATKATPKEHRRNKFIVRNCNIDSINGQETLASMGLANKSFLSDDIDIINEKKVVCENDDHYGSNRDNVNNKATVEKEDMKDSNIKNETVVNNEPSLTNKQIEHSGNSYEHSSKNVEMKLESSPPQSCNDWNMNEKTREVQSCVKNVAATKTRNNPGKMDDVANMDARVSSKSNHNMHKRSFSDFAISVQKSDPLVEFKQNTSARKKGVLISNIFRKLSSALHSSSSANDAALCNSQKASIINTQKRITLDSGIVLKSALKKAASQESNGTRHKHSQSDCTAITTDPDLEKKLVCNHVS